MPNFSFPDKKTRENLGPIIKKEVERARFDKDSDPMYLDHIKKIQKVLKKHFLVKLSYLHISF